jgi:hypothetical protein
MSLILEVEPDDIPSYEYKSEVPDITAGGIVYIESEDEYYMEDGS